MSALPRLGAIRVGHRIRLRDTDIHVLDEGAGPLVICLSGLGGAWYDWQPLADFYTEDATYGWNIGPKEDVMCVNKDEIRDVALGLEMEGLENWVYEYQKVLIDNQQHIRYIGLCYRHWRMGKSHA